MRIVQIIDSLDTGGAERIAVNYANALAARIEFSGLIATRAEGNLRQTVDQRVNYLFLKKTRTLDFKAVANVRKYCISNKIDYIHAHSTSYFIAVLVKIVLPGVRLIWHDHNGMSEFLESAKAVPMNVASFFFKGIVVVNTQLKSWAERKLHCKHVIYIPNFTVPEDNRPRETWLHGIPGKQILSLANLREQKNHRFLLSVAEMLKSSHPDWTFHLIGKDFEDDYSKTVINLINTMELQQHVYVYGAKSDIAAIISQAEIAILTSRSEGLPVALLEYGLYRKPVVVTKVGEMPLIIADNCNGFIIPNNNEPLFYEALVKLIGDENLRRKFGDRLFDTITDIYSEQAAMRQYLTWIENLEDA